MTDADRAEKALQGMIETLMQTGVKKPDILAALDRLRASHSDGANFPLLQGRPRKG